MVRIGPRNLKTALAVIICLGISKLLTLDYPFFVAIAAIISMENSLANSLRAGRNRMAGTIIGAGFGLICALIDPGNPFLCGIALIMVIYCCNLLKWHKPVAFAGVVFMAVMLTVKGKNPYIYSINRIFDTFIGIIIAVIINYLVFPPNYIPQIYRSINDLSFKIEPVINDLLEIKKNDIFPLEQDLAKVNELIKLASEDSRVRFIKKKTNHTPKHYDIETKIANFNEILLHMRILDKMDFNLIKNYSNVRSAALDISNQIPFWLEPRPESTNIIIFLYHIQKILTLYQEINGLPLATQPEENIKHP